MSLKYDIKNFYDKIKEYIQERNQFENTNITEEDKELIVKINELKIHFKDAETKILQLKKYHNQIIKNGMKTFCIFQHNVLKAVISENVEKLLINAVFKLTKKCDCKLQLQSYYFAPYKNTVIIQHKKELFDLDNDLKYCIIEIFDHRYRTYQPFICWITIYVPAGTLYIIDSLKFRQVLPKLNLLKCNIKKIIHCEECVKLLYEEFGEIGCYVNFNYIPKNIFIDHRIRPIPKVVIGFMKNSMQQILQKIMTNIVYSRYKYTCKVLTMEEKTTEFKIKNKIKEDIPYLNNLLQFRDFLARKYDESIQFILPDYQLLILIQFNPTSVNDFTNCLKKISPILRIHATDILLILRKKKDFSVSNLKQPLIKLTDI